MRDTFTQHSAELPQGIKGRVLDPSKTALLVIDMVREGMHAFPLEESQSMVSQVEAFIDETGIRPIYCNTIGKEEESLRGRPTIKKKSAWGDHALSLEVSKKPPSAFLLDILYGIKVPSDLERFLKKYGITDILVVGVESPICVWDTALDGVEHGYNVGIVDDLTWTSKWVQNGKNYPPVTPERAEAAGISLLTSDEIKAMLLITPSEAPAIERNPLNSDFAPRIP